MKNPAGFRQTLRTLDNTPAAGVVIVINDDYADGRDVSWLWDVDFAALAAHPARISTSGTRAADMALAAALRRGRHRRGGDRIRRRRCGWRSPRSSPASTVVVFSTYTAMWELHAVLLRIGKESS